jgi:hypothetical protein
VRQRDGRVPKEASGDYEGQTRGKQRENKRKMERKQEGVSDRGSAEDR